ncbi:MAG: ABC transporter substrate-binding protein, partial [Acetobacteraceae bacterium]
RTLGLITAGAAIFPATTLRAAEPVRGGTLNMIVEPEPPTLMLGINKLGPVSFVGGKIYEGLITLSPDLKPLPAVAKSWDISADGLTYVFHLNEGITWHDGKPFSSADVVFSFKEFLPKVFARTRSVMDRMASITAPDDNTMIFKLKEPFPAVMMIFEVTGGTLVPRHIYEGTDYMKNPANQTPIGTGPFKFKEWQRGAFIHLVRNEAYWRKGKPYLDNIYFQVLPDANSRSTAFETGQVDALRGGDVENFEVKRLAALKGVAISEKGWEFYDPLAIINVNLRNKPLDDVRFRQALSHAIDRDFIVKTVFSGFGKPAYGPMTSVTPFNDPTVLIEYRYDPAKAAALLDQMGLKPNGDGVRATLRLMPLPYGETWQRFAEYVRDRLSAVGIKTSIQAVDVAGWAQRLTSGNFDIAFNFVYLLGDPAMGVAQTYLSTNQLDRGTAANVDGYVNTGVDQEFAEAASMVDPDQRRKIYARIQHTLSSDIPVVWSHQLVFPTLYRAKVHDLITTGLGTNETFADVWLARS